MGVLAEQEHPRAFVVSWLRARHSRGGARYACFAVQTAIAFGELKGRREHRPRRTEQTRAGETEDALF